MLGACYLKDRGEEEMWRGAGMGLSKAAIKDLLIFFYGGSLEAVRG